MPKKDFPNVDENIGQTSPCKTRIKQVKLAFGSKRPQARALLEKGDQPTPNQEALANQIYKTFDLQDKSYTDCIKVLTNKGTSSMRKDSGTAYLLWALGLCGVCGLQRFYLGQPVPGVLYLLTFGVCGVGQLIDLFLIPGEVSNANLRASVNNNQQNIVVHVGNNNNTSEFANEKAESRPKPKTLKPLTLSHKILEVCSTPEPISLSQIIIATGEPIAEIKKEAEELAAQGLIVQTISEEGVLLYKTH